MGLEELNLDLSGWVSGGWVAGLIENITNSAKLKLELELSLAKTKVVSTSYDMFQSHVRQKLLVLTMYLQVRKTLTAQVRENFT